MGIDVQYLINEWNQMRLTLTPSARKFLGDVRADRELAELSLLSGRQEMWEAFACLMGFAQVGGRNPNDILNAIPFQEELAGKRTDDSFLTYAAQFKTLQRAQFVAAAYVLTTALAQGSIAIKPENVEQFEKCYRKHDSKPEFDDCMKRTAEPETVRHGREKSK